jgi:hypothetical protein
MIGTRFLALISQKSVAIQSFCLRSNSYNAVPLPAKMSSLSLAIVTGDPIAIMIGVVETNLSQTLRSRTDCDSKRSVSHAVYSLGMRNGNVPQKDNPENVINALGGCLFGKDFALI